MGHRGHLVQTGCMDSPVSAAPGEAPELFVSYSWASGEHVAWVTSLAGRLRADGVNARLDKWDVRIGDDLNLYMEQYTEVSSRVLVVLSDDYGMKAAQRGRQPSGVATETAIITPTVYRNLASNRVIPVIPGSGTVAGDPVVPTYLDGRHWIDFRYDHEGAYEKLVRELHGVPLEAAPQLGPNPFIGKTASQATALIHNNPARWRDTSSSGSVEVNLNQNSGRFVIGSGEASFPMNLDYLSGSSVRPGGSQRVRHYKDDIGNIGLISEASDRPERFSDLSNLPMSNRVEVTEPGDVLVMLNRNGYWALLAHDDTQFRSGPNGFEAIALMRYAIATDRSASITLDSLPRQDPAGA